jgi:hypothetical protein
VAMSPTKTRRSCTAKVLVSSASKMLRSKIAGGWTCALSLIGQMAAMTLHIAPMGAGCQAIDCALGGVPYAGATLSQTTGRSLFV